MQDVPIHPKNRFDIPFIASNILFLVILIILMTVVIGRYRQTIDKVTLRDNRFLTVEWSLLQQMKAESDILIRQKEQEIAELRQKYQLSLEEDNTPDTLRDIQRQLDRAHAERDELLARRTYAALDALNESGYSEGISADTLRSGETLRRYIAELEHTLDYYRSLLPSQTAEPEEDTQADTSDRIDETAAYLRSELAVLEDAAAPSVSEIKTRSLLRAIINSPYVRAEYPGLLETYDSHFNNYGRRMKLQGKRDAYLELLTIISPKDN